MQPSYEQSVNKFIEYRLKTVAAVRPEDYVAVPRLGAVDPRARADSAVWAPQFFRAQWNPHSAVPPPRASFHVARKDTYDLLRHEYEVDGTRVAVVETKAFAMLRLLAPPERLLRMSGSEQLAEVNRIGLAALNVKDVWRRRAPSSTDEALAFSTNPSASLMTMHAWDVRVEAGVYKGELYFLCHKKVSQLVGFESSQHWFSEEFRAKHAGSDR